MFGNKSLPSKNYVYGCREPREGMEFLLDQISRKHRYRNNLVALELQRRQQVHQVLREQCPEVLELEVEIEQITRERDALRLEIRQGNSRARNKRGNQQQQAAIKALNERLTVTRGRLKETRSQAYDHHGVRAMLQRVEQDNNCEQKRLRKESGLYWGNYLVVEDAVSNFRKGPPPRFHSWKGGEGSVAVQIQNGLSIDELLAGNDSRVRVVLTGGSCRNDHTRYAELWLRVGSDQREPRWVIAPMILHRDFPEGTRLKWAKLFRRKVGTKWKWEAVLTFSQAVWPQDILPIEDRVGVDLGWRSLPEGIRVAYWVGSDGKEGQVILPWQDVDQRWGVVYHHQSLRDDMFNAAMARLREWIQGRELPEWFQTRTRHLHAWRSQARLAALVLQWRENRIPGDEEIFRQLEGWRVECPRTYHEGNRTKPATTHRYEGWRKQDKHLYDWQSFVRRNATEWREHLFHNFVADLASRYRVAVIEKINWSEMKALPEPEDDTRPINRTARGRQHIAAPGRLAQLITEKFGKHRTVRANPAYTTQDCAVCGKRDPFDSEHELIRTCAHCGCTMDQDERAARNLLATDSHPAGETSAPVQTA